MRHPPSSSVNNTGAYPDEFIPNDQHNELPEAALPLSLPGSLDSPVAVEGVASIPKCAECEAAWLPADVRDLALITAEENPPE
jgi:hypothetical protein